MTKEYLFTFADKGDVVGFPDNYSVTMNFEAESAEQLVEAFRLFLLATGCSESFVNELIGN